MINRISFYTKTYILLGEFMKYLKSFIIYLSIFLITFIINTTLSYFDILKENTTMIFNILSFIISIFISSIYIGLKSNNKGYIEGIKQGTIITLFIIIISNIVLKNKLTILSFLSYIIIIVISTIGSIIGINKKKNTN